MDIAKEARRESMEETYKTVVSVSKIIYDAILHHGPGSAWQIAAALNRPVYTVRPRLTELEDEGRIKAVGSRVCSETGRKETIWDVTDTQMELG